MTMLFSGIFDLLGLMRSKLPPQIVIAMILMVLKAPIYFSTLAHLRERGGELAWASRGFTGGEFQDLPLVSSLPSAIPSDWYRRRGLGSQTLSLPLRVVTLTRTGWPGMGGMGGGGNTLGSESAPPAPTAPGGFPSGGFRLGGDDGPRPPQTRDGYSAIA